MRSSRALAAALLLLALAACSPDPAELTGRTAASQSASGQNPADPVEPVEVVEEQPLITSVPDPLEPMNRAIYRFNFELDSYVLLPIVNAYRYVVPEFLRTGVSNFFNNLLEITNANNGLLQARPEIASRAVIRFAVNSTVGVLGFFDVATKLGVTERREDFGQTLGWWGVPAGPYLVLPVLGPSGARDATGLAVDYAASVYVPPGREINELVFSNPAVLALFIVNARYSQPFRYFSTGSAFDYELVRFLYRTQREFEIQR